MADICNEIILYYESQITLLKTIHKYTHDTKTPIPYGQSCDQIIKSRQRLIQLLGYDAADEIVDAATDVQERSSIFRS